MESESENLKFKQKCKDLKKRIGEIDENNEVITIAISRSKLAIKRLRMEYAMLLERLERKAIAPESKAGAGGSGSQVSKNGVSSTVQGHNRQNSSGVSNNDSLGDSYSQVSSPELPSLKLNELNPTSSRRKNAGSKLKLKNKERDPKLPKRPTNSYLIFCEMEKDKIRQRLEETSPPGYMFDMSKALTEAWKNLGEEDKKPYFKLYEEDKERYSRELKVYNEEKSREESAKAKGAEKSTEEPEEEKGAAMTVKPDPEQAEAREKEEVTEEAMAEGEDVAAGARSKKHTLSDLLDNGDEDTGAAKKPKVVAEEEEEKNLDKVNEQEHHKQEEPKGETGEAVSVGAKDSAAVSNEETGTGERAAADNNDTAGSEEQVGAAEQ